MGASHATPEQDRATCDHMQHAVPTGKAYPRLGGQKRSHDSRTQVPLSAMTLSRMHFTFCVAVTALVSTSNIALRFASLAARLHKHGDIIRHD